MPTDQHTSPLAKLARVPFPIVLVLLMCAAILLLERWTVLNVYLATGIILLQLALCYYLIASFLADRRESELHLKQSHDRLEETVKQRTVELTNLSRHLMTVREEEKARIARELHDELGSSLTAVNMDLAWVRQRLDDAILVTRLTRAAQVLSSTVEAKRRIIHDLRPTSLDNLGVSAAIESYALDFSQRAGIPIEVDVEEELPALADGMPIALFRILQEALTNVSRHAQATSIQVALHAQDSRILLEVVDNGVGIDLSSDERKPASYGLLGIRERTSGLGGQVSLQRGPEGHGTALRVTLPVKAHQQAAVS